MEDAKAKKPKKQKKYKYYKASFVVGKKADGTPERIYVRGKTKPERDEKLREAKRLHARGLNLGEMTVHEWSERWLAVYKANASASQKDHYRAKLKYDILPSLGHMRIKDVRASHLQELLNKYNGGKKGTVEKIHSAIMQLFADAAYEGIIERDPAVRLKLPELTEEPRRPLTEAERRVVLKAAETHKHGAYFLTMLHTGIRRGECLALEKRDIDFANKRISINKALSLYRNTAVVAGTKASKLRKRKRNDEDFGARIVPIPDVLFPVLVDLCRDKQDSDLLFTNKDGTYYTNMSSMYMWTSFIRQCHIIAGAKLKKNAVQRETSSFDNKITPHYLRHTYATDLYAAGVDEKARKEFLGHASSDVTDIYTKMSDEAFDRALKLINNYYFCEKWDKNGAKKNSDRA